MGLPERAHFAYVDGMMEAGLAAPSGWVYTLARKVLPNTDFHHLVQRMGQGSADFLVSWGGR
jgi:hypothetical protein